MGSNGRIAVEQLVRDIFGPDESLTIANGERMIDSRSVPGLKKDSNKQNMTYHDDDNKHICDHCDYRAGKKRILNQHIQDIHNGVKHSCEYCDYKATTKGNL